MMLLPFPVLGAAIVLLLLAIDAAAAVAETWMNKHAKDALQCA